jgi:hypothetical protein
MSDRVLLFRASRSDMQAGADPWRNVEKHGSSIANSYFFVKRP